MTQKTELAPDTLGQAPSRLYDRYIFDLDGTIYLGKSLLPGAYRMITKLRELNKRVVFLSNNPTRDVDMYVQKLTGLGLPTTKDEIVTTVFTSRQPDDLRLQF